MDDNKLLKSISYRGTVLHEIAQMEIMLNLYLAVFFCGKDRDKIANISLLILGDDRINLGAKAQVFSYISENHDREKALLYESIRDDNRKKNRIPMAMDLVHVIEERNVFAHRLLDGGRVKGMNDLHGIQSDDTIRFVKFKNEPKPIDYNSERFDVLINTIRNLAFSLSDMVGELP
jgi:hypothetical protein